MSNTKIMIERNRNATILNSENASILKTPIRLKISPSKQYVKARIQGEINFKNLFNF